MGTEILKGSNDTEAKERRLPSPLQRWDKCNEV